MTQPTADHNMLDPCLLAAASGGRRTRFLAISIAALAVLSVAMGVSFLGNTGTTTITVKESSSEFVFPVGSAGFKLTEKAKEEVKVGKLNFASSESAGVLPEWSPTANAAGEVGKAGDLALINANTDKLIVNIYVTNLVGLQADYSSFALPIYIYEATKSGCEGLASKVCETGKVGGWEKNAELSKTYLTNTEGNLSFSLPSGHYYDIAIFTGGSFYTISTTAGELSPSFYFTAQVV